MESANPIPDSPLLITPSDIRLLNLSYSSNLLLHTCPRRYQLHKLKSKKIDIEDNGEGLTFAYGHAFGLGVQLLLQGLTYEQAIFEVFNSWKLDLYEENTKQNKSFFKLLFGLQQFEVISKSKLLRDYELVEFNGKPAIELGFRITFPDGFKYRGFVDAVLRHKVTGEILVLEIKTTSSKTLTVAQYKNSAQAIGYSIVLDHIFPEYSSYKVLYLPYKTQAMEFEPMEFTKSYLQRALWLQELLLDIETIKLYESAGVYPMHGESCYNFYRECEFFGLCTLSTDRLTTAMTEKEIEELEEKESVYDIEVTFSDLVATQLAKTGTETSEVIEASKAGDKDDDGLNYL